MSDDPRDVLLAATAPEFDGEKARDLLAATEDMLLDLAHALQIARRQNDPDSLLPIAVEAIVAALGVEAGAKSLEQRFGAVRKAARALSTGFRQTLGASLASSPHKRVDGSSHAAVAASGVRSVEVYDEALLPDDLWVVTRTPNKDAIGRRMKAGEDVPGAKWKPGPDTVRILALETRIKA